MLLPGQAQRPLGITDLLNSCSPVSYAQKLTYAGMGDVPFTTLTSANLLLLRRAQQLGLPGLIISCPDLEREALAVSFLAALEHLYSGDRRGIIEPAQGKRFAIGDCVIEVTRIDETSIWYKANGQSGSEGILKERFDPTITHLACSNSELTNTRKHRLVDAISRYQGLSSGLRRILDNCGAAIPSVGYLTSPSQYLNEAPTRIPGGSILLDGTPHELSEVLPISYVSPDGRWKSDFKWPFASPPSILVGPRVDGVGTSRPILETLPGGVDLDFFSINIPSPDTLNTTLLSDIRDLIKRGVAVIGFCDRWTLDHAKPLLDLGLLPIDWADLKDLKLPDSCVLSPRQKNALSRGSDVFISVNDEGLGLAQAKQIIYDSLSHVAMNTDSAAQAQQDLFNLLGGAIRMSEPPSEDYCARRAEMMDNALDEIADSRTLTEASFEELEDACKALARFYQQGFIPPKEEKLFETLSLRIEGSGCVTLVVDQERTDQALLYWKRELEENGIPSDSLKVANIRDFMASRGISGNEPVVFCGWYDRGTMDRAIHAGIASDLTLILYNDGTGGLEVGWWNKARDAWRKAEDRCARETDLSFEKLSVSPPQRRKRSYVSLKTLDGSDEREKDTSPAAIVSQIERKRLEKDLARAGERSVYATPVLFDDGSHVWLRASDNKSEGGRLIVITDCLAGTSDSYEKKAASALLANDVVLRTHSSRGIISQISRNSNDDHETILGTARAWRAPIEKARKRGIPDSEIIEQIHSRLPDGRSFQTVRAWVVGQDRIAPRSVEDLRAIFAAFGERPSEEQISEVAKAARKIRGQHQRAGAFLKEEMVKAFLDDVHLYGIENALNGFHRRHNIGYVELLKVSAVGERANVAAERVEVI